jgi:hypothetical protein
MFLQPYIGENYSTGINNQKVLIIGESHYSENFDNSIETSDFTHEVTSGIIKDQVPIRFFQYVGSLFNENWTEIWQNVAFANLVQHVFENSTDQPNDDHKKTIISFYKYLDILKPDKVIVCSSRAWVEWFNTYIDSYEGVERHPQHPIGISCVFKYPYSDGKSMTIGINHPSDRNTNSRELYVNKWKNEIDKFLAVNE